MKLVLRAVIITVLVAASLTARGQTPDSANLRGDSAQTRKRLAEAEQKLLAGKTADATDDLQRILDEAGDDLITVDGKQYRPARWLVHGLLAKLPPDALKSYQDRIDDPARKLLDAAKAARDAAPLWQLLDRYFVSRPADDALLLLGDLLFESGEFRLAEHQWRRLLPEANADIVYPNSKANPASVGARVVLAAIFQGETDRAKVELAAFKSKFGDAKGMLAGKSAPYADILQAYLDKPPKLTPTANSGANWPTFGGSADRSARVGLRLPRDLPAQPTWKADIPTGRRNAPPIQQPFGNPVIVNGHVFVTDGSKLHRFDLVTGKCTATLNLNNSTGFGGGLEPCPTLTAAGDRLYVRLGAGTLKAIEGAKGASETSIACIVRTTASDGTPTLKELWQLKPPATEGKSPIAWEGTPLVAGRRMWAAYARFEGGRVIHGIACYDPADSTPVPERPVWTADVSDSPMFGSDGRARHELLTLVGRNIVFSTNAGAVVALDATTGRRTWGFRYNRARKADSNRTSDPAPAVASGGRVFVAPTDADRVYALDPDTGRVLWESWPTEGVQIVGVTTDRLVVAVASPVRGIRGLNVATGSYLEPDGWHNGGGFLGYGRGFVMDDAIVWPTQGGLFFLNPDDGSPFPTLIGQHTRFFGNMVFANGVLVVVTPTQVWFYVSDTKRFGPPGPRTDRDPARTRFEELREQAENALVLGELTTARNALLLLARSDLPKPYRAWGAARLLLLTPKTDAESKLPPDLRQVLTAQLRDEWLIPPDGVPATLGTLLDRHLGREAVSVFVPPSPRLPSERKPDDAPLLSPDAEIEHSRHLATGSAPLRWIPGMATPPMRIFAATANELFAIPLAAGDNTRHEATDQFTHAADIRDGFVAAGPFAVAVYGNDRTPIWVFRVPAIDPLPKRPGESRFCSFNLCPLAELSSFRLIGSWLIARLGERHLIALDLSSKRVAWVLGANGKPGFQPFSFPDATRFGPEFAAAGQLIVVQLSDGRRWFVRAETGKVLDVPGFGEQTARVWWPLAPVEIDAARLPVADGPGLVRMLNLATGKVKWTHEEEGSTSLTGEPPQIRALSDALLIAVRRNHGVEIDRLNSADGKSIWRSGPAFLDADRVQFANADADSEHVYIPFGNTLAAFTLKDGKSAWEIELPDTHGAGGWVVRAGQKCVIVYPETAIPREPVADVLDRVTRSFWNEPAPWRLPGLAAGLYDAWVARTVPVMLLDPETGKRLAKFEIPATGPAVTAWFEREVAVVATGNRVVWLR